MAQTELFLLFPKYKESNQDESYYLVKQDLMYQEELHDYIEKILIFNGFFAHEVYQGYYDALNVAAFAYPFDEIEECYPGEKTYLRSVLKEWENWRDKPLQKEEDQFVLYAVPIKNDTLCEMAKRKENQSENAFLLINHQALRCSESELKVKYNGKEQTLQIRAIELKEIAKWFAQYRKPQRIYHWNPKHGEFGNGAHSEHRGETVSKLLGSREEAQKLLKKAIGIQSTGTLFYYDADYQHYMEFKMESTNTFHSFHIEDESRVPKAIKEKIKRVEE